MNIIIKNQNFTLHHLGAIYWKNQNTVLVSDVHFGKVTHFRKHGVAIPREIILENFTKLNQLLAEFKPNRIIFLGDLFHSGLNSEWNYFEEWIDTKTQEILLIEGNHDVIATEKYENLNIKLFSELIIDDFILTHFPLETTDYFNFCGHIHPGVKMVGKGKQFLKLACFFQNKNQMILPAFGAFTGKYYLEPTAENTIYGIADATVFKVNFN